ncbi:MAG TPA: hypothetical protein VMG08_16220 [Allosphingosinicella sp.]|nr:hypothetical protein [Allosphingosinicella sp.]
MTAALVECGQFLNVSPDVLHRLQAIDDLDLSPAQARMEVDFPGTSGGHEAVSREVKRFFALALLEPNPQHRLVIGERIDGLWHYFILHTQVYRRFCSEVFGSYLHHNPVLPANKAELAADYDRTRKLYARYFGEPPAALWGDGDMICWGGCDEIREETLH